MRRRFITPRRLAQPLRALAASAAAIALLGACERDIYSVQLEPTGSGFQRELKVVRERHDGQRSAPPAEILDRLSALYGGPEPQTFATFGAAFGVETPDDVGGRGALARQTTPLGTVFVYIERFRGEDDPSARLARTQQAASVAAGLVLGWLDRELADEPQWPALRATLADGKFDRDFRNMAILAWLAKNSARFGAAAPEPADEQALLIQLGAYLHEHGYITGAQLPLAWKALADDGGLSPLLVAWLARAMGVGEDALPEAFASDDALGASWEAYLQESPGADRRLRRWAERAELASPDDAEIGLDDLVGHVATIATGSEPSDAGDEDEVHVSLGVAVEPITTNGSWDPDAGQVTWSFQVEPTEDAAYLTPAVAFAAWAEADEAYQTGRFGRVVLMGEQLAAYAAWRAGLSPDERSRWDRFVDGLTPGGDTLQAINGYQPGEDPAWAESRDGRAILRDALGG